MLVASTTFVSLDATSLSRRKVCSELFWTLLNVLVLHTILSHSSYAGPSTAMVGSEQIVVAVSFTVTTEFLAGTTVCLCRYTMARTMRVLELTTVEAILLSCSPNDL